MWTCISSPLSVAFLKNSSCGSTVVWAMPPGSQWPDTRPRRAVNEFPTQTLVEAARWPSKVKAIADKIASWRPSCAYKARQNIALSTHCSGCCTVEWAAHILGKAEVGPKMRSVFACDITPACRRSMNAVPEPIQHHFGDVLLRLPEDVRAYAQKAEEHTYDERMLAISEATLDTTAHC